MKYPDKYTKSTDELMKLSRKERVKYFNKKRMYMARKLLADPFNAVEEFEKLSDQQLATGVISKKEHDQFKQTLQEQIEEFQSMQPHEIKNTIVQEAKDIKDSTKRAVKGWFKR